MARRKRYSALGSREVTTAAQSPSDIGLSQLRRWWQYVSSSNKSSDHFKSHELTFILRTLSTLIVNGVSLPKALGTLAKEDTLAKHREVLDTLRRKVESGVAFSTAVSYFPHMCDAITVNQIRVGERSGTLGDTLRQLSENRDQSAELRSAVIKKLAYPALLVTLGSGLITFLLMYVLPVFQETYDKAHVPLPFITQLLIAFGAFAKHYGWMLVAAAIFTATGIKQLRKRNDIATRMDRAMLKMPLFGNWLRDIAVLQLMEVLHNLMAAGYTLAEALLETGETVGNRAVKQGVHDLQVAVQRGERFSRELERLESLFPPIVNQLVIVGESTGQLTRVTSDICDYLRREIERKTNLIVSALEPILTISLSGAVAVVLLAIYLPMFDMINVVSS
ncbi:MAG: type II secretion system F family protein [Planctomycetes bacterium]|nr:type II secretion system F family protein [Planctomycetota bacterium]